jgi:DNA primase
MDELIILEELEHILGPSSKKSKNNYAFLCPKCQHPKKKLEVNILTGQWSCWVCSASNSFKGKTLKSLLKSLNLSPSQNKIFKLISPHSTENDVIKEKVVSLPQEYINLTNTSNNDIIANHAKIYLKNRGLTDVDIKKYNIGFCKVGRYENCIIIPSYDSKGQINFFSARNFNPNSK